jgi:Zn-dependent peptidase ImmA (M78 family)
MMTAISTEQPTKSSIPLKVELPDFDGVKQKAHNLLMSYYVGTIPVNAYKIAQSEGISVQQTVFRSEFRDITALIECSGETIIVNREKPFGHCNFAVAHGLGHIILEHPICEKGENYHRFYFDRLKTEKDRTEKEANFFAMNLLAPDFVLRTLLRAKPSISDDELAEILSAPVEVVRLRRFFVY